MIPLAKSSFPGLLLVEDDREIRHSLKEVLEAEGFRIHTASNGQEGLDALLALVNRYCETAS